MHWKPVKKTVELGAAARPPARPSRIRRDPVPINTNVPVTARRTANSRERDLYFGVAGIVIIAAAIGAFVTMLAMFTVFRDDPAADARAAQFSQCYNAEGANCVLDGGTIFVGRERIAIAGMEAPKINDAACDAEQTRGVDAATGLAMLLNSGPVTMSAPFRDETGRTVRKVEVQGRDVALTMIDRDLAHEAGSGLKWCH